MTVSMLTKDEETVGNGIVGENEALGNVLNRWISSENIGLCGIEKIEFNGCDYPIRREIDWIWNRLVTGN